MAELVAQVMARILILQYAHQYSITPITHPFVLYDNESAAAAFSKIPKSQKSLGLLGNILDVSCKGAYTRTAHHVCSQDCHPYTDHADSICTHSGHYLSNKLCHKGFLPREEESHGQRRLCHPQRGQSAAWSGDLPQRKQQTMWYDFHGWQDSHHLHI